MRDAIRACLAAAFFLSPIAAATDGEQKVVQGDDPWLITEFRQAEQAVVVGGGDVFGLAPEAAVSLRYQLEMRDKQRQGRRDEDPRFSATVSVGKDFAGRPIITAITVH
jgi:hypothetical protein